MDFFKFTPTGEQTFLERGEFITNLERSVWVERYSVPGEFAFEARLSTGIRENLPLGTLISHVDTLEVQIVEDHEIKETIDEDPIVTVTGRSFPSYLENRIIGMNAARSSSLITPYTVSSANSWNQIVSIISDHIVSPVEDSDSLDFIAVTTTVTGGTGGANERIINRGTVWERVSELLNIDDLGIKTIRRNAFAGVSSANTTIVIYRGIDRSANVRFSWKSRDLDAANYLFSQRDLKNAAAVFGQYVCVVVSTTGDKYDRRMMIVDAADIDGHLGAAPSGGEVFPIAVLMATRGLQTLAKQKQIVLSQADISKTTQYQYRRDYNMGDLVTLDGNFNQSVVMRVVEYAEIEDENGESGHPTLSIPGGT